MVDESYNSGLKLQSASLRAEPSAAGGQREFVGEAPDAAAILQLFPKIRIFRHILV